MAIRIRLEFLGDGNLLEAGKRPLQGLGDLGVELDLLLEKGLHTNGYVLDLLFVELVDLGKGHVADDLTTRRHVHQILAKQLIGLGLELLVGLYGILLELYDLRHLLDDATVQEESVQERANVVLWLLAKRVANLVVVVATGDNGA